VRFAISPLDIACQVFFAQLLPLGIGAALRAWRPAVTARIEPWLAVISNLMLLALIALCVIVLGPRFAVIGWAAFVAGAGLTLCVLLAGALFARRELSVKPAAAIAAAMRNLGLALLIATRNAAPPDVTVAVFEYALGLAAIVLAFVTWRRWRARRRVPEQARKTV